jgi:hypothetical protein
MMRFLNLKKDMLYGCGMKSAACMHQNRLRMKCLLHSALIQFASAFSPGVKPVQANASG